MFRDGCKHGVICFYFRLKCAQHIPIEELALHSDRSAAKATLLPESDLHSARSVFRLTAEPRGENGFDCFSSLASEETLRGVS